MQAKIYCRTTEKGKQTFYVNVNGKDYLLFTQDYRVSNKDFFRNGIGTHRLGSYSSAHSESVRKTLDKLPSYLHYIEQEYEVVIYNKKQEKTKQKNKKQYKRTSFNWKQIEEVA